jgi:hypothetical protein
LLRRSLILGVKIAKVSATANGGMASRRARPKLSSWPTTPTAVNTIKTTAATSNPSRRRNAELSTRRFLLLGSLTPSNPALSRAVRPSRDGRAVARRPVPGQLLPCTELQHKGRHVVSASGQPQRACCCCVDDSRTRWRHDSRRAGCHRPISWSGGQHFPTHQRLRASTASAGNSGWRRLGTQPRAARQFLHGCDADRDSRTFPPVPAWTWSTRSPPNADPHRTWLSQCPRNYRPNGERSVPATS